MSDEQIVNNEVVAPEPVSQEVTNTSTPENEASDNSLPVTSLDDAKKVLASVKSKPKPSAPTKTSSTEPDSVDYQKQYQEIQKLVGKQSKELGELRNFHKTNQPVIEAYKQFLAQQQEADLLAKYQTDPTAVIKELARREAAQHIAPYQEQMSQAQATTINSSIKEQLGADYETYAPVMAEMLDGFLEMDAAQGTSYATELAQNPHILMQLAAGKIALTNKAQNAQQQQVAQQQKAKNLQAANGVGKGNNVSSVQTGNFKDLSLEEMTATLRKQGIIR